VIKMDENKKMYEVSCDDTQACGLSIKGYDKKDLEEELKYHAKRKHNIDAKDEEIEAKIKEV
jgi:predicted small metal-binding protein